MKIKTSELQHKPRRPLYDDEPEGYMGSPNDYVLNNVWLAERLLDLYAEGKLGAEVGELL